MPAKVGSSSKAEIKDQYIGEWQHQLRHGYGVYTYDNKFFRYEGQWADGLKHGHGKLVLGDGGYYEGSFVKGEIQGHGYRVFGLSRTTYSGQFQQGVIHGQGLLKKQNGEQYEGGWAFGKKEGEGIYTDAKGGVFEGSFHDNKRHGEGRQVYSNGDQYEGDWVLDKRHGHGLYRSIDGTIYDGQWRGDVYHGEGSISHCSGVTYTGLWHNGRPAREAVRLHCLNCESDGVLIVEQGTTFSLSVQCVDTNGQPISTENGRSFKVSASIKKEVSPRKSTKRKSKLTITTSPLKDKLQAPSPFGYPVMPYSLLQVPGTSDGSQIDLSTVNSKGMQSQESLELHTVKTSAGGSSTSLTIDIITSSSTDIEVKPSSQASQCTNLLQPGLSSQDTRSLLMGKNLDTICSEETKIKKKDEDFLEKLVPPYTAQIISGVAVFKELYLPPPALPDISHIVTPAVSRTDSESRKSPVKSRPGSRMTPSPSSRGSPSLKVKKSSEKIKAEKERLLNPKREKYALPGTYVLVVSEVTDPPFLGYSLPDFCVELKLLQQKNKEPSVDKLLKAKSKLKTASRMAL